MGAMRKGSGFTPYPCAALRKGSGVPRTFLLTVSMPRLAKKYAEKNFQSAGQKLTEPAQKFSKFRAERSQSSAQKFSKNFAQKS